MWWGASLRSQGLRDSIPLGGGGTLKPSSSPGPPINRYIIFFDLFFWVTGGVVFFSFWRAFSLQKWANDRQNVSTKGWPGQIWVKNRFYSIIGSFWGVVLFLFFWGGTQFDPQLGPSSSQAFGMEGSGCQQAAFFDPA